MVTILPFLSARKSGWSQVEQAEFVRATMILRGTGLPVVTETGLSDEGDPWTVFLREDTGDVVVHISRIDGCVIAASAATEDVVSGPSFRAVMDRIIRSQPLVLPTTRSGASILMHPSAVITAFIATAFVWSYSEEASVQQYDWRIASDGTVEAAPTWSRAVQSTSILRESILSKAEAMANGLDSVNSLSGRFVMSASVAAVALVAELAAPTVSDQLQSATTSGHFEGEDLNASHGEQIPQVARTHSEDVLELAAHPTDTQLTFLSLHDGLISFGHLANRQSSDASPYIVSTEAADHVSSLPDASTCTSGALDGPTYFPLDVAHSNFAQVRLANEPVANVEIRAEPLHELSPILNISASGPGKILAGHFTVSAEATELLTLIFSPRELSDSLHVPSRLALHDNIQFDAAKVAMGQEVQPNDNRGVPADSSALTDKGYRLLDDILTFAFDHSKEIAASQSMLKGFSTALKANAFLPEVDRVLIIDVPDLRAEAFKFTDDVVMISHNLAAQLLPNLTLQTQSELGLANGSMLKLIGVIDMTPEVNGYGA